jgi:hypothetical protein
MTYALFPEAIVPAVRIARVWATPSADTFSIPPVRDLLRRHLDGPSVVIDPFARNSGWGTITNDLNPDTTAQRHLPAEEFVAQLGAEGVAADAALFDPPYSPRQISEVYQKVGLRCGTKDTQNGRLYAVVKSGLDRILKPGAVVVCCGWNSAGFGKARGYELSEILIVCHGAAHNDTIVTVERKAGAA